MRTCLTCIPYDYAFKDILCMHISQRSDLKKIGSLEKLNARQLSYACHKTHFIFTCYQMLYYYGLHYYGYPNFRISSMAQLKFMSRACISSKSWFQEYKQNPMQISNILCTKPWFPLQEWFPEANIWIIRTWF